MDETNWPLIVRELCEGYMGLNPLVIEQMHVDQILLLVCDKRLLAGKPRLVTGTPEELAAKGFIDDLPEMSYVQALRERIARDRRGRKSEPVQRADG